MNQGVARQKIVVTGADGQLAQELKFVIPEAVFLSRHDCDLARSDQITAILGTILPDLIVNCGAYTQVDRAETDQDTCNKVNAIAPVLMAGFAKKMIHLSTDYVFGADAVRSRPYRETDTPGPINIYGASKLAGETALLKQFPNALVIRTSWLYSTCFGKNFFLTMQRLFAERDQVRVVNDQMGTPTSARALAQVLGRFIDNPSTNGVYHYSGQGQATWFDFAQEIKNLLGASAQVIPVKSNEFITPAKRPHYSVLDKTKIEQNLGISILGWRDQLRQDVQEFQCRIAHE